MVYVLEMRGDERGDGGVGRRKQTEFAGQLRSQTEFGNDRFEFSGRYSAGTHACSCHQAASDSLLPRNILRSARGMLATRMG